MHGDEEHTREEQSTKPLVLPLAEDPPSSASDVLRPLSQVTAEWSVPVPTSGSLASLAMQKAQQQLGSPHKNNTRLDETSQSESQIGATPESHTDASIQEFIATAWRSFSHQPHRDSSSSLQPGPADLSLDSDHGKKSLESPVHSPYASIYTEDIDPYTLFMRRFDEPPDGSQKTIQKCTESIQLFRRKEDDRQIWRRRVTEYR
jgi:hypothetical protein